MTSIEGVDYSYARPNAQQLQAAGKKFAVRYITPPGTGNKGISQAEFDDLRSHDIYVVAVWEQAAGDAKKGRAQGVSDAKAAQAGLERIVGLPDQAPVYFAVDWDASQSELAGPVHDYFAGAASVLGSERVGIYGGYVAVAWARLSGLVSWYWQTYAWSSGKLHPDAHLYQYSNGVSLAGGQVDLVRALKDEYGVHPVTKEKPSAMPEINTVKGFKSSSRYAYLMPNGVQGRGRDDNGTFLRVQDNSSTATTKKLVPTKKGSTNPLYVVRTTAISGVKVTGVTIDGGSQGFLYNGLRVEKTTAPQLKELRFLGVPGNSDVPPGETFAINLWQTKDSTVSDVEIDGEGKGASGLGLNSSTGGTTTLLTAHDLRYCKAVALWQHKSGHTFDRVQSLNNAFGFGFERCTGTYTLKQCKFRGSTRADIHLASDTGRCKLMIVDPDLGGKKLKILLPATEMGKPNKQTKSDVTLMVAGKSRPDLIEWVTKA